MSDNDLTRRVSEFLVRSHFENAVEATRYADQSGAFLESVLDALFGDAVPMVPDANVLRPNIARMCRDGHRPVLLTGAHSGAFRLYCADHVLEEVVKHTEEWALDLNVPEASYSNCWREEFLPYIRRVATTNLLELLSPSERARIAELERRDADDVPSATLALAMGALYITQDTAARFAVYGVEANAEERSNWLATLRCAGDASELHRLMFVAAGAPIVGVQGMWSLGRWLLDKSPLALVAAAAGVAALLAKIPRENYKATWGILREGLYSFFEGVMMPYYENVDRLEAALPNIPSWEELMVTNTRDSVLARACLHTLSRSRSSPIRAGVLANELPDLGIGQTAQRIGKMLRNHGCFTETCSGLWQVGEAIVRGPEGDYEGNTRGTQV